MQKVYFMSAYGTLMDSETGKVGPAADFGRIAAVCALRAEDVSDGFGYLAVVDVPTARQEQAFVAADDRKPSEPIDEPFIRQAARSTARPDAAMIVNTRTLHVVN